MKEVWGLWLSEISSFSTIPGFFEQFFSDRQYQTILFEIISGQPDLDTQLAEKERLDELERRKDEIKGHAVPYIYNYMKEEDFTFNFWNIEFFLDIQIFL